MDDGFSTRLPSTPEGVDAHLTEFEQWFTERQRRHNLEGGRLIVIEQAILRSYLVWQRECAELRHADPSERKV